MSDFAIIEAQGKQYKVTNGSTIQIDKIDKSKGDEVVFDQVLCIYKNDKLKVGSPYIEKTKIKGKIERTVKGPKIRINKFKAKSRYRKSQGHRQTYTLVTIDKI